MPRTPKPKARDFPTDSGLHSAMKEWADQQGPTTELEVWVEFPDGSGGMFETIPRATKEVEYKTRDGEVYTVAVRTSKFVDSVWGCFEPLSRKEMEAAAKAWFARDLKNPPRKLRFNLVEVYAA